MQEARAALATEILADAPISLAKVRLQRGFSQEQLARAIGTSQPHIARIEAGASLLWNTAVRLADALGVSLDDLRPLLENGSAKQHG